jgi:hypothetical protein
MQLSPATWLSSACITRVGSHQLDTLCTAGLGFHVETDLADAPRVIGIRTAALKQKEVDNLLQVSN